MYQATLTGLYDAWGDDACVLDTEYMDNISTAIDQGKVFLGVCSYLDAYRKHKSNLASKDAKISMDNIKVFCDQLKFTVASEYYSWR